MKKYGLPLLIIIVGSLLWNLTYSYLGAGLICTLIRVCTVFGFGVSLAQFRKRSQNGWVKKLIIAFFVFFLVCWELGYLTFPQLRSVIDFLGLTSFGFNLLYVYCGWSFFD